MKKFPIMCLLFIPLFIPFFQGCMKMALRLSPSLFPNLTASLFEECDPELAGNAIPANLKLLEGLLKNDPQNRQVLLTLCKGFCGYSLLFIEDENPIKASRFYLRAKEYGLKALSTDNAVLEKMNATEFRAWLSEIKGTDIETLFWIAISWNAWISLNLDNPQALSQMSLSQACLDRVLEMDPDYLYGLPYILTGTSLAARPPMFGGNMDLSKGFFEKALSLNQRKFFLTQYYYAKYYAVRNQDRLLFNSLLDEIIQNDPKNLPDVCLINSVMQIKAKRLREMTDELFF